MGNSTGVNEQSETTISAIEKIFSGSDNPNSDFFANSFLLISPN